jgi:hypothetical protein
MHQDRVRDHGARRALPLRSLAILLATTALFGVRPLRADVVVALTADTEGHVGACQTCPGHAGFGGLERRATAVKALRQQDGGLLLLDAGNALFGGDSLDTGGKVIVAAYDALGYAAVNVSHRDFRLGRQATLDLFQGARLAAVSANVLDAASGEPLFRPWVVVESSGRKIAVLGVTAPPPGLDTLPHLKRQLAGVRIAPPEEALARWLPKAKAESDEVVVMYYGSARGARALGDQFGKDVAAILVGGVRPEQLPAGGAPPLVATDEHGKFLARVRLSNGGKADAVQVPIDPALAPDAETATVLAAYAPKPLLVPGDRPPETPAVADADRPPAAEMKSGAPPAGTPVASNIPSPGAPPSAEPQTVPAQTVPAQTVPAQTVPAQTVPPLPPEQAPARVSAKQPLEPKGLAGAGLTAGQVHAAIDRGADFLWKYSLAEAENSRSKFGFSAQYNLLTALALVKAGAHQRLPDFDEQLRAFLGRVRPEEVGVYGAGVLCMLLESYGDAEFHPLLRLTTRFILEAQSAEGSWDYYPKIPADVLLDPNAGRALQVWGGRPTDGSPAEQWRRLTEPGKHVGGDNSITQYALLGLHAASRVGVEVPREAWQRTLDLFRARQGELGGWGYVGSSSADYGSMTCAGIYGIALCRFHLGEKAPAEDEAVERGLAWMAKRFTVSENPNALKSWHYYYLYSLERAARTVDAEFIGPHEWYPLGAKYLVDEQKPDGSWIEPGPYETRPEVSTSFALLFLTRGTASLTQARPTGGNGTLKTGIIEPAAPRVYVIFDCSGSMLVETGGRPKFEVARDALTEIVDGLPDHTQLALRVYGHRKTARDKDADEDTELVVPMGPMQRAAFSDRVRRLRARGKTPLARSIAAAAQDLAGSGADNRCAVILITDGGEDTRPPGDPVAAAAELARVPGVTLHVVGFDIGRDDWGRQLRAVAKAGGGRYWPANDAAALRGELRAAVLRTPEQFTIAGADGRPVWRGSFGQSKSLPEGRYVFTTDFAGKPFNEPLWVNTGSTTAVLFDAGKIDVAEPADARTPPQTLPADSEKPAGSPARAKFCSECGKVLGPGAKFCANCGKRVGTSR